MRVTYENGDTENLSYDEGDISLGMFSHTTLETEDTEVTVTYGDKTAPIAVKVHPILAGGQSWFDASKAGRNNIKTIKIVDSYTGESTISWNAAVDNDGVPGLDPDIKCYVEGDTLFIAGNGTGKICANSESSSAFYKFESVTSIEGLDILDTSRVKLMRRMFMECRQLVSLDLSTWDTSNVTNMWSVFEACYNLKTVNLSNWNTSKVENMQSMFKNCWNLTPLEVNHFDTSKVCYFDAIFGCCAVLTELDLSNWDTSSAKTVGDMFYECKKLKTIYVSDKWALGEAVTGADMFRSCWELIGGYGTKWANGKDGIYYARIDGGAPAPGYFTDKNAEPIIILAANSSWYKGTGNADKSKITEIEIMDSYTPDPEANVVQQWNGDIANSGSIKCYVEGTKLTIAGNGAGKIYANADSRNVFNGFKSVTSIEGLKFLDTSDVVWMEAMFKDCWKLTTLDVSGFDTSNVTNFKQTFALCAERLTELDLSNWDTSSATTVKEMFYRCDVLKTIYVSDKWVLNEGTDTSGMFNSCKKLVGGQGTTYNSGKINGQYARIDDAFNGNPGYFTDKNAETIAILAANSSWYKGTGNADKSKITEIEIKDSYTPGPEAVVVQQWNGDIADSGSIKCYVEGTKLTIAGNGTGKIYANGNSSSAFSGFTAATSITGLGLFDTSKVTNMKQMFSSCTSLTDLDLSTWDTSKVTTLEETFNSCTALTHLNVSTWNTSSVTSMRKTFVNCSSLTTLDVSSFNTSKVTDMLGIFFNCSSLVTLTVGSWETSKVANMSFMFNCPALTTIYALNGWDLGAVTDSRYTFDNCGKLVGGNGTKWSSDKVGKDYACVDTEETPGYFTLMGGTEVPGGSNISSEPDSVHIATPSELD